MVEVQRTREPDIKLVDEERRWTWRGTCFTGGDGLGGGRYLSRDSCGWRNKDLAVRRTVEVVMGGGGGLGGGGGGLGGGLGLEEDSVVDSVAMEVDSADSVVDSAGAYIDISIVRVSLSIPPPSSSILSIFSPRQFPRFDLQLLSLRLISFSPINCSRSRLHTRLFLHSCETYSHRYAFLDRLSIRE